MTFKVNYAKARLRDEDTELDKAMDALDRSIAKLARHAGIDIKAITKYPAFKSVESCVKCGMEFYEWDRKEQKMISPRTYYMPSVNLMSCICPNCQYAWRELCADGSDPIEEEPKEDTQPMMPVKDAVKLIDELRSVLYNTGCSIEARFMNVLLTEGSTYQRVTEFRKVVTTPVNEVLKRMAKESDDLYGKYFLDDGNDS